MFCKTSLLYRVITVSDNYMLPIPVGLVVILTLSQLCTCLMKMWWEVTYNSSQTRWRSCITYQGCPQSSCTAHISFLYKHNDWAWFSRLCGHCCCFLFSLSSLFCTVKAVIWTDDRVSDFLRLSLMQQQVSVFMKPYFKKMGETAGNLQFFKGGILWWGIKLPNSVWMVQTS